MLIYFILLTLTQTKQSTNTLMIVSWREVAKLLVSLMYKVDYQNSDMILGRHPSDNPR